MASRPDARTAACALRHDVCAKFAIRQADAQLDARFAVFDRDGGELVGVEDEADLKPGFLRGGEVVGLLLLLSQQQAGIELQSPVP
jgi:hypothetical protein